MSGFILLWNGVCAGFYLKVLTMKKIMIALFFFAAVIAGNTAQAQQLRFYYYPKANVYYDPASRQYIYYDNSNWTTVQTLPSTIIVKDVPRVTVYSKTPQVWQMNAEHKEKYKNYNGKYPKGKAVGYKGTNPNRMNGKTKKERDKDQY